MSSFGDMTAFKPEEKKHYIYSKPMTHITRLPVQRPC